MTQSYTKQLQADYSFPGGIPAPPYTLDPEVEPKLDPVYKEFFHKHLSTNSSILYTHRTPLVDIRTGGNVVPGQTPLVELAQTFDIEISRNLTEGPPIAARVFVPLGEVPAQGFPVYVWYHGGGHVLGNIATENSYCSHMAADAHCVVVSVDYRLAPEDPFPAAPDDAFESLVWALKTDKIGDIAVNPHKVAVGGSSAGGNLAAVAVHKLLALPEAESLPSVKFQVLVVPVTDCTANPSNTDSWKEFEFTPQLPAEKMLWYRAVYLSKDEFEDPEASPLFYSDASFAKNPPAIICVAGCDVLKSEGLKYGEKLKANGVKVTANVYEGCPHPVMAMDAILEQGRQLLRDVADALNETWKA